MHTRHFILLCVLALFAACNAPDPDLEVEYEDQRFAVPLVNSDLRVSTVTDNTDGTFIEVGSDGLVTVVYRGNVVEQKATDIFMPVDTVLPIPIIPGLPYPLPVSEDGDRIDKAIFGATNIWFTYINDTDRAKNVRVRFLNFTKDGDVFEVSFTAAANTTTTSPEFSLTDVAVSSTGNTINFEVIATHDDGSAAESGIPVLLFDQFDLKYIEGKFAERIFDIEGDIITVGIFDQWISGNATFSDPKLKVEVDNGFGLPVESIFNQMTITDTEKDVLNIESTLIDDGVTVAYPSLAEQGQTKLTTFAFDKDNSNIVELFGQRATRVTYDIDARVNPGSPDDLVGFMDQESAFRIQVDVEVPLEGEINDFVLESDEEFDGEDLDGVKTAEFKAIFDNGFPMDMFTQVIFQDDKGRALDSLFADGEVVLAAGSLGTDGRVNGSTTTTIILPFDESRIANIKKCKSLFIRSRFDTPDAYGSRVGIYNDYRMGFKLGAILTLD